MSRDLFADAGEPDGMNALGKVLSNYADALLENPPIPSLSPARTPDLHQRQKIASTIATKDVLRVLDALADANLSEEELAALFRERREGRRRKAEKQLRQQEAAAGGSLRPARSGLTSPIPEKEAI